MTPSELSEFVAKHDHITRYDYPEDDAVGFRNSRLPWYKNNPDGCTKITYKKMAGLTAQELETEIDRGLKVENITRVTGYFTKTSQWNKGKIAELKDRRRTDLYGNPPHITINTPEPQAVAAAG